MFARTLIALFALITLLSPAAFAKDAEFDAFWTKFKAALQKNDKEAIASMTRFPYTSYDKTLGKKEFIAYCGKIFGKKTRDCLIKQTPVKDKTSYFAFCGEEIYIFDKAKGTYQFTEIGVND